jgi:hypothetical protein
MDWPKRRWIGPKVDGEINFKDPEYKIGLIASSPLFARKERRK